MYEWAVQYAQGLDCGALDLVPVASCMTSTLQHILLLIMPRPDSGGITVGKP